MSDMIDIAFQVVPTATSATFQWNLGQGLTILQEAAQKVAHITTDTPEAKITAINLIKQALIDCSFKISKNTVDAIEFAQTYCPVQVPDWAQWLVNRLKETAQDMGNSSNKALETINKCMAENKVQEALYHAHNSLQEKLDAIRSWMETCSIVTAVVNLLFASWSLRQTIKICRQSTRLSIDSTNILLEQAEELTQSENDFKELVTQAKRGAIKYGKQLIIEVQTIQGRVAGAELAITKVKHEVEMGQVKVEHGQTTHASGIISNLVTIGLASYSVGKCFINPWIGAATLILSAASGIIHYYGTVKSGEALKALELIHANATEQLRRLEIVKTNVETEKKRIEAIIAMTKPKAKS